MRELKRCSFPTFLLLLALPVGLAAQESQLIGRVREGKPKKYVVHIKQAMEHTVANSTVPVRREFWDLTCEAKEGEGSSGTDCALGRIVVDPCGVSRGRGATLTSFRHESSRGTFIVKAIDLKKGVLEFELKELGGDGVYGVNQMTGEIRFGYGGTDEINLLSLSGKGTFQTCGNDDYHEVNLAPPSKDYLIEVPLRFKAGPQGEKRGTVPN